MASKPIQIAVALTRAGEEQHGQQTTLVLCDDGRIFERRQSTMDPIDQPDGTWEEVKGPWIEPLKPVNLRCQSTKIHPRFERMLQCHHTNGHKGYHGCEGIGWLDSDA